MLVDVVIVVGVLIVDVIVVIVDVSVSLSLVGRRRSLRRQIVNRSGEQERHSHDQP